MKKITASLCHDSLTATFTLPDELVLITQHQITEELKDCCYKHCFAKFPSENCGEATVHLDTMSQFSCFVSWLTDTIAQNW